MKRIKLTKGKCAIVDDDDFEFVNQWKWYAHESQKTCYYVARRDTSNRFIYLHRFLINVEQGNTVDHINGNRLDNRRSNLRICSSKENQRNRGPQKNNTSGYKGVTWNKDKGLWQAQIMVDRHHITIGCFVSKIIAAKTYDEAARKYFGEYARTNF